MFHILDALSYRSPCFTSPSHRTFQPAQAITRDCLHSSSSRYFIMDAQWQQYYWNHYLLQQQQHQQLATTEAATTHPSTSHHSYNPTGTYGPLTHALRTHQTHHTHPYTPPPQQPQVTPPSKPEFPPPPPPPLPTAAPVTPPGSSFKHSPQPGAHAGPGSAPPPPPHIPSPKPPLQDSWHQTDHHWDATHSTATSSIAQYNLPNGHARQVLAAFQHSTFFPGNSHTTARPSIQHAPL